MVEILTLSSLLCSKGRLFSFSLPHFKCKRNTSNGAVLVGLLWG